MQDKSLSNAKPIMGSQTLIRGLDIIESVNGGITSLHDLSHHLGLTRSTTYRLATALVEREYLSTTPRGGYSLGARLTAIQPKAPYSVSAPVYDRSGALMARLSLTDVREDFDRTRIEGLDDTMRQCAQAISARLAQNKDI